MTTKDYVYLSLLALSAVVFYWTGFYGGFNTTLKMLQHKEDDQNSAQDFEAKTPVSDLVSLGSLPLPASESSRQTSPALDDGVQVRVRESSFGRN
ncbi:MAG: hypothetical protein HY299_11060 [Verrucomicrobia bacterium]|nr:hypothetical protein [Verrucomicrobiota bacterium]